MSKSLTRSWSHLALGAGVGRVFGFLSNLLLSRWLGPVDLGLFNLFSNTVQTSDTLSRLGGDYALNYHLGSQKKPLTTTKGRLLASAFTQICLACSLCICLFLALWTVLANGLIPSSISDNQRNTWLILLISMVLLECNCAPAWEILLVMRRTKELSFRQGLFIPLRLFSAALGALFYGPTGSLCGWVFIASSQCIWLKYHLQQSWSPLNLFSPRLYIFKLLKTGFSFYVSNLTSSIIFYTLLLKVAATTGLSEIGYLRVGQVLQQLFAFLPSTLVPVLFLQLRSQKDFNSQISNLERPLRIIWLLLIFLLGIYCTLDHWIILTLFGSVFSDAINPTRLLVFTTVVECLFQLISQPYLASRRVRVYGIWLNSSAVISATLGWFLIPQLGLSAYLLVRLLYPLFPLLGLSIPIAEHLYQAYRAVPLIVSTVCWLAFLLLELFIPVPPIYTAFLGLSTILFLLCSMKSDLADLVHHLMKRFA